MLLLSSLGTSSCTNYSVSVASYVVSQYSTKQIFLDQLKQLLILFIPNCDLELFTWALSNVLVLVLVGLAMWLIGMVLVVMQCGCKLLSSPKERYWVWSIRATRFFVVLGAYIIALLAAVGLFNVNSLHANVLDPVIGIEQVVAEKYQLTANLAQIIKEVATEFNQTIPQQYEVVIQFVDQMGLDHRKIKLLEDYSMIISDYAHLILATGFGLVICVCITSILFALTKHKFVPMFSIILVLMVILLIWLFSIITGTVSLVLAKECNNGLDDLTMTYIVNNTNLSPCFRSAIGHYLLCMPWNNNTSTVPDPNNNNVDCNPFGESISFIGSLVEFLRNFPQYQSVLDKLLLANDTITDIESCSFSQQVYSESKRNVCWDVTNVSMQITLLYIIQGPMLLVLLFYVLFAWYRFNIQRLPYVVKSPSTPQMEIRLEDEEINREELQLLDPSTSQGDDSSLGRVNMTGTETETDTTTASSPRMVTTDSTMPSLLAEFFDLIQNKEVRQIMKKNVRTLAFTGVLFCVVFVMIFVWLGIVNNFEEVHNNQLC